MTGCGEPRLRSGLAWLWDRLAFALERAIFFLAAVMIGFAWTDQRQTSCCFYLKIMHSILTVANCAVALRRYRSSRRCSTFWLTSLRTATAWPAGTICLLRFG